ncbi:MAG: LL-diaminopimelate aminotransferase [Lachnospiraceae bacterium]|nr:LL-diaminopimelate aminotransferase [Lachnospiraceae bacterium]
MKLNENYRNLKQSYLFAETAHRTNAYIEAHPDQKVIRLGIGDVTLPLAQSVVQAMQEAAAEMGKAETFRGYGPEQGYAFLREAIRDYYARNGVAIDADEVFITDGAKSDTGNITDLFDQDNVILVPDPVYPVYVDTNTMNGRKIIYADANKENDFLPMPDPSVHADIIYICSPNNPTGAAYNKDQLKAWVDYALANEALLLYDSAYECFVGQEGLPRSIFQIPGAKKCAIEFCSLSKTAGFTGTRCGYTIVPKELVFAASDGTEMSVRQMWLRRQTTKFNGVSYIIQRGAAAVFTEEGMAECRKNIEYYKENAKIIADTFTELGINFYGGINSPYIWFECPFGMESWAFFDYMLEKIQVVGTPGAGFGANGTNYFRLTSFGSRENTVEAMSRFLKMMAEA